MSTRRREMEAYVRLMVQFFKTTTLHGFKYLCAKCYCDRVGWLVCCCASACCAAVLCTVVWARYMQMPALLTLQELRAHHARVDMPMVAVCPPADTVATMFANYFSLNESTENHIRPIFSKLLRRKNTRDDRLAMLGMILDAHNLTLTQALFQILPQCDHFIKYCQWRSDVVPCSLLFKKELTQWGVCCVKKPANIEIPTPARSQLELTKILNLALQCSDEETLYNCEFFTKYDVEEWVEPITLIPGHSYVAQLTFTSVIDSDPDTILTGSCAYHQNFSKSKCLLQCMEDRCGCLDAIRLTIPGEKVTLHTCPVQKLNCLRRVRRDDPNCNCLPPCKKVTTGLSLEASRMNAFNYSVDSMIAGLNKTLATLLSIRVRISGSRMFVVNPTETWITLLSSLGGIFNMFLGVGFFSALELLFLLLVRLPIVFRRSSEMNHHHSRQ